MVPVGLVGLAITTPFNGAWRWAAISALADSTPACRQPRSRSAPGSQRAPKGYAGMADSPDWPGYPIARLEHARNARMKPHEEPVGNPHRAGSSDTGHRPPRSGGRYARAATGYRAFRYIRCAHALSGLAPPGGRGRCRRRRLAYFHVHDPAPAASIAAAAAASRPITINGGTLLRLEGVNSRFAASSMVIGPSGAPSPRCCRIQKACLAYSAHAFFMTQS